MCGYVFLLQKQQNKNLLGLLDKRTGFSMQLKFKILIIELRTFRCGQGIFPLVQTTAMNYRTIMFRPESFREILLDKVCFMICPINMVD